MLRRKLSTTAQQRLQTDASWTSGVERVPPAPLVVRLRLDDMPVELVEHILSFVGADAWSLASCAQVCVLWRRLLAASALWGRALFDVFNPTWGKMSPDAPELRCFYTLNMDARAHAAHVISPAQMCAVARLQLVAVRLIGPNVHKEAAHLVRLALELPGTSTLVLQRCELAEGAVAAIGAHLCRLHTLVVTDWGEHTRLLCALGTQLPLRALVLLNCGARDRDLLVLCKHFSWLSRLVVAGRHQCTREGCRDLAARFSFLRFQASYTLPPVRRRRFHVANDEHGPVPRTSDNAAPTDPGSHPNAHVPGAHVPSAYVPSAIRPWADQEYWEKV